MEGIRCRTPRVLHLITSLDVGGAELLLARVLAQLAPADDHRVLCLRPPGQVAEQVAAAGVNVRYLKPGASTVAAVRSEIRQHGAEIVHTWLVHAALLGEVAAPGTGAKLLLSVHHDTLAAERRATRAVGRLVLGLHRRAAATVFTSYASRDSHVRRGWTGSSYVVPNGVPAPVVPPGARERIRSELGLSNSAPVVAQVARLHAQKDHLTGLEALAAARRRLPEMKALLVGRGVQALAPAVDQFGLADCVLLLGPRSDVPELLAASDVLLLSSRSGETSPLVIGEALAQGLDVVATDVGDCARMLHDVGQTTPAERPDLLAEALVETLSSRSAYRSERARERWNEHFHITSTTKGYVQIYRELLDR